MQKDGKLHGKTTPKHCLREFKSAVDDFCLSYCMDFSRKKSEDFGKAPKHSKSVAASAMY